MSEDRKTPPLGRQGVVTLEELSKLVSDHGGSLTIEHASIPAAGFLAMIQEIMAPKAGAVPKRRGRPPKLPLQPTAKRRGRPPKAKKS
jgi:hypothetical protein